jgi:hypothetical protein
MIEVTMARNREFIGAALFSLFLDRGAGRGQKSLLKNGGKNYSPDALT